MKKYKTLKSVLKANNLKEYNYDFGMFEFSFNVIVGDLEDAVPYVGYKLDEDDESFIRGLLGLDSANDARGKYIHRSGYAPIVWIPKNPKTSRDIATLSHEILHVIFCLFEWTGMNINGETEEMMTHAHASALTDLLDQLKLCKSSA